jgi:RNA-directed DNA polymerase
MMDRAIQAVVSLSLDPVIEETSDNHSYGSRKFRSPHDAINRTRHILDKPKSARFILDVDIKQCFDNLSHEFIMKELESKLCNTGKVFIKE